MAVLCLFVANQSGTISGWAPVPWQENPSPDGWLD